MNLFKIVQIRNRKWEIKMIHCINISTRFYSRTGVGLGICVQASTGCLDQSFFLLLNPHIWLTLEAYGSAVPSISGLSLGSLLSPFLTGIEFLSTVTVMQTRITLGWWDTDKLHGRSSVSLPVCPCLRQLDTLY